MKELYINSQPQLTLDITGGVGRVTLVDPPIARFYENSSLTPAATLESLDVGGGQYLVDIPYFLMDEEKTIDVKWTYLVADVEYVRSETYSIVTPYVTLNEIRDAEPSLADMEDQPVIELEQVARYTINAIVGQSFGKSYQTLYVRGGDSNFMPLPQKLYKLDSVTGAASLDFNLAEYGIDIGSDGYSLSYRYATDPDREVTVTGPIFVPSFFNGWFFDRDSEYVVKGWFGWNEVPADIKLAARLLIGDFICNEDVYRRKQVLSINSGNWRMDFAKGAFSGTGNLDVDRILSYYATSRMEII